MTERSACPLGAGADLPDHDVELASRLGRTLTRLLRMLGRTRAHAMTEGTKDGGGFPLLAVLSDNGPSRMQAVATQLLLDPSTTSRHVANLVDRGWVARNPDPSDRRACQLELTDDGAAALADWRARRDRMLASVTVSWSRHDREELVRLLEKLVGELTDRVQHLPDDPSDPLPQEISA